MFKLIKKISIEVHNKCTRNCYFCPGHLSDNVNSDKNGNFRYMSEEMLEYICDKILENKELFSDNLLILFYGFAELTYKSEILKKCIHIINKKLRNKINFKTRIIVNGDLIDNIFLDNIIGIDHITINDYEGIGIKRFIEISKKCNINISNLRIINIELQFIKKIINVFDKKRNINIYYVTNTNDIKVFNLGSCIFKNYDYIRKEKCGSIGKELMFDSNGIVKICTNVNQDIEEHKEVCKWNIKKQPLKEIIKEINNLNIPNPCLHCDNRWEFCIE